MRPSGRLLVSILLASSAPSRADSTVAPSCVDASAPEMKGEAYIGTSEGTWSGTVGRL